MAGPWLSSTSRILYDYTKDLKFLKETGYELIGQSSANFTVDYLWHKPDGTLWLPPLLTEHGPIDQGATFVHAVVREILLDTIQAVKSWE